MFMIRSRLTIPKFTCQLINFNASKSMVKASRYLTTSSVKFDLSNHSKKTPKTSRIVTSQKLRRTNRLNGFNKTSDILTSYTNDPNYIIKPVTTFTTCEKYNLDKIHKDADLTSLNIHVLIPNEILHFKYEGEHDVLIYESGSIIGWGIDEVSLNDKILPLFENYTIGKYEFNESEDMDFVELKLNENEESHFVEETIVINVFDKNQALLDKAAFSSGLSRSTRLAILESALERHILQTKKITEGLSLGKNLTITEKELLRRTGRLYLIRGKLNLYSELIEIPDLYWSEPILERIYKKTSNILDISPRISILNSKLDYVTDESRALMSTLNEAKSTRLEWIIIILIMIEVCFETFHFYERYEDHKARHEQK